MLRALMVPLALSTGCTIIFDADDLRHRDAMPSLPVPDAEPPDAIPVDADVTMLEVTGASPESVDEGVGGEGGRPALIQILGSQIAGDAIVTVEFVEASLAPPLLVDIGRAPSGNSIAAAVQIPVLSDLAAGATRTLRLTVSQNDGNTVGFVDVPVNGLDELTIDSSPRTAASLAAKYSHIDVTAAVHFTGTAPVRLVATGDIVISALIDVDGVGATAGVQGCAGGPATMNGGCAGGTAGASSTIGAGAGGGGGGYGTAGSPGTNASATLLGGAGGGTSGNDMLIPFLTAGTGAGNRGAGGGGGGNSTVGAAGGPGGGGGGVILLQAGGDIVVSGAGAIRSKGGDGAGAGGGGGGGAGGAILVRAGGTISGAAWLSAPGGAGAPGTNAGGAGGVGRIRVDAPDGDVPGMASEPAAIRGPAWDDSVPVIMRESGTAFQMRGPPGRMVGVTLDGDAAGNFTIGTNGTKTVSDVDLELGLGVHELCVVYTDFGDDPDTSLPEALSCVTVAYFP